MNTPRDLSYRTDFIFHRLNGEIEEHETFWVVRTPSNPDFWFGNLILFKTAPQAGDYARWMQEHAMVWGDSLNHVTFGWDEEREGEVTPFLDAGFIRSHGVVLTLDQLPSDPRINPNLEVRPLSSPAEWESNLALQTEVDSEDYDYPGDHETYRRRRFASYQRLVAEGHGYWWGAFQDGQLVGSMGLYFDETREVGRFQNVATRASHRRQGVCRSLLTAASEDAFSQVGAQRLVIVTGIEDEREAAREAYRNFGFHMHSQTYAIERRPTA
jgi:RimJ/RimL family protein N-acetyltransferase